MTFNMRRQPTGHITLTSAPGAIIPQPGQVAACLLRDGSTPDPLVREISDRLGIKTLLRLRGGGPDGIYQTLVEERGDRVPDPHQSGLDYLTRLSYRASSSLANLDIPLTGITTRR